MRGDGRRERRRIGPLRAGLFTVLVIALVLIGLGEAALLVRNVGLEQKAAAARRGRLDDPEATKILFLGDSWTEGGQTGSDGEGYWAYVPEALAEAGYPRPVQTATVALAGSTSWFQYEQLLLFLEETPLPPDYVMVVTGVNDPRSFEQARRFCAEHAEREEIPLVARLWVCGPRGLSFLHGLGARAAARGRRDLRSLEVPPGLERIAPEYEAWRRQGLGRAFQAMTDAIEEAGARPLFGSYHTGEADPMRENLARNAGIRFHSIDREEVRRTLEDGEMFVDGWHTNEDGDRYLARLFAEWFVLVARR